MRRYMKVLICAVLITALFFNFSCSSYATGLLGSQAAGAWVAAGLVALNIVAHTGAQAIGSYFGWQSAPSAQSVLDYSFPVASDIISDYMNAATIKVDKGVTTIDGVVYDELWIEPGTFTDGLKTNLFDFKTKWNILSGNAGTLATGVGFVNTIPVYSVNNETITQTESYPIENTGDYNIFDTFISRCINEELDENWRSFYIYSDSGVEIQAIRSYAYVGHTNDSWNRIQIVNGNPILQQGFDNWGTSRWLNINGSTQYLTYTPGDFQFNYVSGIVPAEKADIPENYGLSIQIPHNQLQTFYNTYPQYNVDNSVININQDNIDIDELTQAIFDRITSIDEIKSSWKETEEPEPEPEPAPVPDPEPDPFPNPEVEPYPDPIPTGDETIAETAWKHLITGIKNVFDNISIGNQAIQTIANFNNQIKNFLSNILSEIKQIGERIVEGDREWFEKVIDSIKAPFLPWLNIFKSGVSIWRYVVQWVSNISAPFAYFINILVNVNPILVSPFYAIAAGCVVIAIYRRFGR